MKNIFLFMLIMIATGALATVTAEQIPEGWWTQTASTAGDSDMIVAMNINCETPHIISLDSNNGWIGYAWYSEAEDLYKGFFELIRPESAPERKDWTGEVFQVELGFDGLTLTMQAASDNRKFQATFWQK
ncbi:MAG: hypothetical protein PQJ59_12165 [Spirochaetales bacterium]|nr:hypothetical protein [Spirochaetales bacterium]